MNDCEQIEIKGVAFELSTDSKGRIHVSKYGNHLAGYIEPAPDGGFRVSFIDGSFADKRSAIEHLAYWYTMKRYKEPLGIKSIQRPDGSVSKLVSASTDSPLQLTVWHIEIHMEDARTAISRLPEVEEVSLGKERVYKAEIGLKVHRAIELILKVLLGIDGEPDGWRLDSSNRAHDLTPLYDKLKQRNTQVAMGLEELFQKTVMIHGDPRFAKLSGRLWNMCSEDWIFPGSVNNGVDRLYERVKKTILGSLPRLRRLSKMRFLSESSPRVPADRLPPANCVSFAECCRYNP